MNCTEVLARFTDYLDGTAPAGVVRSIEAHLDGCQQCVRYKTVIQDGSAVLRSLPEPELREDFEPRLQHRLYHVDDERALGTEAASSTSAVTVLGIAVLLTAVAWSPKLFVGVPVVELDPIVVDEAPRSPFRPASASPPGTFSTKAEEDVSGGLWANTLLYDYSPLSQRYERRARVRRASQQLGR